MRAGSSVPQVRFDRLMKRIERKLVLDDSVEYERVGVRWYGNGAFVRDRVFGTDIARKQQWIICDGDVVYNKLFGWKGAFALAGAAVDGRIVSDKFPTYEIDQSKLDARYLAYFFRTPGPADQAVNLSKGAAAISKLTLNPPRFWDITIPLPSLDEQQRIVAHLDEIASRVGNAIAAQAQSRDAVRALGAAFLREHKSACVATPLEQVLTLRPQDIAVDPATEYKFAGVYSFGRGVFRGPVKQGGEFSYRRLTQLAEGDFVYPKLMAWEGAFGVAMQEHAGLVVSPEFPVFELDTERVLPETLSVYFGQPDVWSAIAGTSRGTNVRRRRLHPKTFLAHLIPLPPIEVQQALKQLVSSMRAISATQERVVADLDAVIPSLLAEVFEKEPEDARAYL